MNTVCHIEIQSVDLDRSEAFYKGVFDWTFRSFMPSMRVFASGEDYVGGLMLVDAVQPGRSPSIWIKIANIEETLAKVQAQGGRTLSERSEVPTVGWSADFEDVDGNYIGIVQFL
jgi:predicted enzyme related to lactoylglutathione lyase